jgi:hypothetical protein
MFRRRFLMAAIVAGIATLAGPATGRADFKLRLDFGNNGSYETTITDNQAGDSDPTVGVINFSTSGGGFSVLVNVGSSKPVLTSGQMDLLNLTISGGAGVVAVELTDTGFPGTPGAYTFSVGGTTTTSLGLLSFEAGGTSSDTEFDLSNSTGPLNPTGTGGTGFATSAQFANGGADPYSLTIRAVVEHTAPGQITSFDAHLTPVPAPAGLVLAATALPFVGILRRRLRRPETATAA